MQNWLRETEIDLKTIKDKIGDGASTTEPSIRLENNCPNSAIE